MTVHMERALSGIRAHFVPASFACALPALPVDIFLVFVVGVCAMPFP